jgi:hypothetical protein
VSGGGLRDRDATVREEKAAIDSVRATGRRDPHPPGTGAEGSQNGELRVISLTLSKKRGAYLGAEER